jgi:hypothetical protein
VRVQVQTSRVLIYPQDARVGKPQEETIDSVKIGRRLEGDRIGIWDQEVRPAWADQQGNYLYTPDNRRFDQVQAFVSSQKTLDVFEMAAQRRLPWAFENPTLGVGPHAGDGANAYYQRFAESLSFYYFDSKALGKRVYTAQSADIVSHETGHAILDGLKPQYGHTFDRETKAFHEAFGDCAAMLLTLSRPENCRQILEETGGDLSKENALSRCGEEFGSAVRRFNQSPKDDRDYLRTHLNDYLYVDPNSLPSDGPRDELTGESHSFCGVFTRGFYALIRQLYESGMTLEEAGARAGQLLVVGTEMASPARARFADVAAGMLRANQLLFGSQDQEGLRSALAQAAISPDAQVTPEFRWDGRPESPEQGQQILSQLGHDELQCTRIWSDGYGLTYLEGLRKDKRCHQELGVCAEEGTGVTLTFSAEGQLIRQSLDPQENSAGLRDELDQPQFLRRLGDHRGLPLLERLPIFVD